MDNNTDTNTSEYKPYNVNDPNNALILAQQNAGNIEVLKGRVDNLDGIKTRVDDMQQNISSMQTQLDGLVQQQSDYAQQLAGDTPPDITGTESQTTANVETSIEEEEKQ
jgi:flagellar biosynthesis chaperone FliJ